MAEENVKKEQHKEHVKKEEHHEGHSEEKKNSLTNSLRKNPWIVTTFVFGIITIILLVPFLGLTGGNVSSAKAGENLVSYLNTIADNVTLKDVKNSNGLYLVTVTYKSNDIPLYVTKDGKMYTSALLPLTQETTPTQETPKEVPKTDIPEVDLYVFTYCPYGVQMQKAAYPVFDLFDEKIDFDINQIGAMHGEYEKTEAIRQLCILKDYPNKYWDYVNQFSLNSAIGACGSNTACSDPLVYVLYSKLGIDKNKITTCMNSDGKALYDAEVKNAQEKGVSGSPTLIINGVEVSVGRNPEAIKDAICSAFKNPPAECSQELSGESASAGFGSGSSSGSSTASC